MTIDPQIREEGSCLLSKETNHGCSALICEYPQECCISFPPYSLHLRFVLHGEQQSCLGNPQGVTVGRMNT